MSERNDGGNAFPFFDERCMNSPEWGMSLRDYFAAKAIQSIITESSHVEMEPSEAMASVSKVAYEIADAMLAERAK